MEKFKGRVSGEEEGEEEKVDVEWRDNRWNVEGDERVEVVKGECCANIGGEEARDVARTGMMEDPGAIIGVREAEVEEIDDAGEEEDNEVAMVMVVGVVLATTVAAVGANETAGSAGTTLPGMTGVMERE